MAYRIKYTNRFKKAVRLCEKRGLPMAELYKALKILERDGQLPNDYKPHKLTGDCTGYWECHIQPDWLLVWEPHKDILVMLMIDTGTHSDIF